jgi:hypothetical protein
VYTIIITARIWSDCIVAFPDGFSVKLFYQYGRHICIYFYSSRECCYCQNKIFQNAVARLVEALRYKPEGRGFDSRWYHWNFSGRAMDLGLTQPLTEMSTRNISWGVKAASA